MMPENETISVNSYLLVAFAPAAVKTGYGKGNQIYHGHKVAVMDWPLL